ncbi:MAG: molybdate transport system ATP-binding protein [Pseudohongiellaceae bacterium]|jgi:molybdate transport system ATP-binding protein
MRLQLSARVVRSSGFTLDVELDCQGQALALVGPSGCGKSTLLEVLAGVLPGRVVIDGRDLSQLPLHQRNLGWVTQDSLLFPHLDVAKNLSYSPRAEGIEEIAEALDLLPLLQRYPAHLSGGERRRVALGRALASRPDVLLLDEPFAGLDAQRRRAALSLIHTVRRRFDVPVVLVSHLADEVVGLADQALRLDAGRVVSSGPAYSVLRAGETHVDNHVQATVSGAETVTVDGVELRMSLPEGTVGQVRLAIYAHDILLARALPEALSARNVLPTQVVSLTEAGGFVLVSLAVAGLVVTVTPEAVAELGLAPGVDVFALLKATSIDCLGPA